MIPDFFQNYNFDNSSKPYCPSNTYENKETTNDNGRLYNDDLIILALIIFLYNEKVNDIYLFIALFMLLLD